MLSPTEEKILTYLRAKASTANKDVTIDVIEASKELGLDPHRVEEVLLDLVTKGYLKIVKAPNAPRLKEYFYTRFARLLIYYYAGKITIEELKRDWDNLFSMLDSIGINLETVPRNPLEMGKVFQDFFDTLQALKRLHEEASKMGVPSDPTSQSNKDAVQLLQKQYNEKLHEQALAILPLVNFLNKTIKNLGEMIIYLETELNAIEVDEKIRNVDRSEEKQDLAKQIKAYRGILRKITTLGVIDDSLRAQLDQLRKALEEYTEQYELYKVKALVEKDLNSLNMAARLQTQIETLQRKIYDIEQELSRRGERQLHELTLLAAEILNNNKEALSQENIDILNQVITALTNIQKIIDYFESKT
jgi:DNA-binding MarR family transcriptional regulator